MPFLTDPAVEVRAQTAKLLGDARYQAAATSLIAALRDQAPRVRFFAAEALGRIGESANATSGLVTMLAENDDQDVYLRHAGSLALSRHERVEPRAASNSISRAPSGWRPSSRSAGCEAQRSRNTSATRMSWSSPKPRGQSMTTAGLPARCRRSRASSSRHDSRVSRSCGARSARTAASAPPNAPIASRCSPRGRVSPKALRVEAVAALGAWSAPSSLDRVDGAYLGPASPQREPQAAQRRARAVRRYRRRRAEPDDADRDHRCGRPCEADESERQTRRTAARRYRPASSHCGACARSRRSKAPICPRR